MDGSRRKEAALLAFSIAFLSVPMQPALAAGPSMQRLVGTVGFTAVDDKKTDVVTGSAIPAGAEAYANCSSLAMISLDDGASLTLGGRTNLVTPSAGGSEATLRSGVVAYEIDGKPATPLTIATAFGNVRIAHGSGWIVVGDGGLQTIVREGGPSDVAVTANSRSTAVPGGQSSFSDATATRLAPIGTVNNPALSQFNDGRNPLGTDRTALYQDPAKSASPMCAAGAVAAGAGAGALALVGLGAAGAIAIAVGHNSGGSATATPATNGTPTPGAATPTPIATATATATATSVATNAPTPTPSATVGTTSAFGPVVLNPSAMVLSPGIGSQAKSTFDASQTGYGGPFTVSQPSCPVGLLGTPTASVSGSTITVSLPSQAAALDLLCTTVVTGGGGMSATEPIEISISALGTLTPTPTPGPGSLGAVVANPASVLLDPGVGSAATQTIAVSQTGYAGPFSAYLDGCIGLGSPPTVVVSGANVTVSLPAQTVAADLGCSVVVSGGGGMQATVPITISVSALGTPTAAPTSSGTAGAGPLTASPSTILLNPAVGAPATQNIIVSPASEGPFYFLTNCQIQLGAPLVTSVTGNVVTVTAPAQAVAAPVGCSVVIVSSATQNSVTVPILVSATGLGGAVPTPSPNPSGHGPLFTIPSSISVDPGVTTDAIQNIEIFDSGYTGTYVVGIASGCLALQQPVAKLVNGNVATVTVPGQLLNVALACTVKISDGTQTIGVPITIAATVLSGLSERPIFDGIAFRPPSLALESAGESAGIDVIGRRAPFHVTSTCPDGATIEAHIAGAHAMVRALTGTRDTVCMVTVTDAAGAFGQVPVRVTGSRFGARPAPISGHLGSSDAANALVLGMGEDRFVPIDGNGPFVLGGNCARIVDADIEGNALHLKARASGTCTVTARALSGAIATVSVVVRRDARERTIQRL